MEAVVIHAKGRQTFDAFVSNISLSCKQHMHSLLSCSHEKMHQTERNNILCNTLPEKNWYSNQEK